MKVISTKTGSSIKGKAVLLAQAIADGKVKNIKTLDDNAQTFAANRDEYNAMKDSGKLPKCFLTGRTCSNSHFVGQSTDGKQIFVGVSVGGLLLKLYSQVKGDLAKLSKEVDSAASKERAKA